MKIVLEQVRKATSGRAAQYLVKQDGLVLGLLEKYRDTRIEQHPWKAFRGVGVACTYLRSFFPNEGGKQAAITAIVQASTCA